LVAPIFRQKIGQAVKPQANSMAVRAAFQLFLAICVGVFVCGCRMAFTPLPRKETRTYQSLLEWSHENGMPGAILLVQTPQTNFLGALGWADVERKIPIRPEHEFRIGSITKMFAGLTVAQLEREGLLKTDSVITNYLPKSITDPIANSDRITVKHLLQHGSGIYDFLDNPRWILRYAVLDRRGDWPPSRHLKYVYNKPARFPPGKRYELTETIGALSGSAPATIQLPFPWRPRFLMTMARQYFSDTRAQCLAIYALRGAIRKGE